MELPGFDRFDRLSDEFKRVLDAAIRERVKDPRVPDMFSLTDVTITRDLKFAKVGVSVLDDADHTLKGCLDALNNASGFLRREVGQRMTIRSVPEINFHADVGIAHSARIQKVLREIGEDKPGD